MSDRDYRVYVEDMMHGYRATQISAVWSVVPADVPALRLALLSLLTKI